MTPNLPSLSVARALQLIAWSNVVIFSLNGSASSWAGPIGTAPFGVLRGALSEFSNVFDIAEARLNPNGTRRHCTATLVGPRVLITAAHCGDSNDIFALQYRAKKTQGRLIRFPGYPTEKGKEGVGHPADDLALVLLDTPLPGVKPMTIADSDFRIHSGKTAAYFVGYGCDQLPRPGDTENPSGEGEQRVGSGKVNNYVFLDSLRFYLGFSGDVQNAQMCPGDSGGPLLSIADSGRERLIGISSSYQDVQGDPKAVGTAFTSLLVHEHRKWLAEMSAAYHLSIVGISPSDGEAIPGGALADRLQKLFQSGPLASDPKESVSPGTRPRAAGTAKGEGN